MVRSPRSAVLLLAFALACSADRNGKAPAQSPTAVAPPKTPPPPTEVHATRDIDLHREGAPTSGSGFVFELSEGNAPPEEIAPGRAKPPAEVEALSADEVAALVARLPPIDAKASDRQDFAMRASTRKLPLAGATKLQEFPPKVSRPKPPAPKVEPLRIERMQPQGEVPLAPHLSITFSQPMVPVASVDQVLAEAIPATLTPKVEGQWRWAGTRTLLFEPKPRFAMATSYTVSIDAGVKSQTGGPLQEPEKFAFGTPPPSVKSFSPGGTTNLSPLMYATFDQRIDPKAVLGHITVLAGKKRTALRLATDAEVKAAGFDGRLAEEKDRAIAFVAKAKLPKSTRIEVRFEKGLPSAEGPRKTTEVRTYRFNTYGPFRFSRAQCAWGGRCYPGSQLRLEFTNSIADFDPAMVTIEPTIEDVKITQSGGAIVVQGRTVGRTTYRLRVGTALKDVYGQGLEKAVDEKITVGPAEPTLTAPGAEMMVLERTKKPSLSVYTMNYGKLDVRIHRVTPSDWYAWLDYKQEHRGRNPPRMPGQQVFKGVVDTPAGEDQLVETKIDLTPGLEDFRGQVFVHVQPHGWKPDPKRSWYWPGAIKWIQVTDLGLDALLDHRDLHAFATRLSDGAPVAAELSVEPYDASAKANADGYAALALAEKSQNRSALLVARAGADLAFLPESLWSSGGTSWTRRELSDGYRYFVFDDRGLYKPKETVQLKGFLRRTTHGPDGDLVGLEKHEGKLVYQVRDARGNEFAKGETKLSRLGGFSFSVDIPDDINLGRAYATFHAPGVGSSSGFSGSHAFSVQEFRRPEFEVGVTTTEGPHLVGQFGVFSAKATYYTGGPLAAADVRWTVRATEGSYTPPNRADFVFGTWSPWWWWGRHHRGGGLSLSRGFNGHTDESGEHHLRLDLLRADPPRPTVVSAEAAVSDVNRQTWSASASFLVHPSTVYIGLKTERNFVEAGKDVEVDVLHVGLDGELVPPKDAEVTFTFQNDGDAKPETCKVEAAEHRCTFGTKKGGQYLIVAKTKDDRGRPNETTMSIWVSGGENVPLSRNISEEQAQLIPDKKTYAAGDVAKILVQAPFADAKGFYSLEREGVVKTGTFETKGTSATLEIPIEERYTPNIHLRVMLVGRQKRRNAEGKIDDELPPRPAFAAGTTSLSIPPATRTLAVELAPDAYEAEPGSASRVALTVKQANGEPAAGAEIAFYVVDEAVLALTNYSTPDPIASMYSNRGSGVRTLRTRQWVYLADPEEVAQTAFEPDEESSGFGDMDDAPEMKKSRARRQAPAMEMAIGSAEAAPGGGGMAAGGAPPIAVRKDFSALAVFAPSVTTDSSGRAEVKFDFPDNLTRYRVIAVAAHGANHFGVAEANITARKALMVRPSAPRFLNYGDRFELPVVLENRTGAPLTAQVVVRATNADVEAAGFSVRIPGEDRVEVRFPTTTDRPGRARFQFAAAADRFSDAAEVDLPVWTPATTEAFATYGEIDEGAIVQPVLPPKDVAKSFGGLEITTASTQLQALTDAYIYILDYPYGCAEQVSSRVITTAALKDVLAAFEAEGMPPEDQVIAAVGRDIKKLAQLQNSDGGWGWWRRDQPSSPFLSIHVMHALVRAQAKNFEIPSTTITRGRQYLRDIDKHIERTWGRPVANTIVAYALYVRAMMGEIDGARAKKLIASMGGVSKLPLEAAGWLYPVAVESPGLRKELAELRRLFDNRATETAATAHFATSYEDGGHVLLHSARRVDALILEGLMRDQPKNTLIPKLVRGLLAHRTKGRWSNTQENAWVLVALDRYFRQYEKITPDFVARMWLGDDYAGDATFKGRTTDQHRIDIPMSFLVDREKSDLLLQKDGAGRLYYRVGLRYAPNDLMLEAASYGFEVKRTYAGVDDPNDVRRDDDGTWRFKAGARIRVQLSMVNTARRYHVALVDPLPAGLEPINAALAGSGTVPPSDPKYDDPWFWWRRAWYVHDNLRDERAEAFSTTLWPGEHSYTYVARATTPGQFVVPPTKAEEMYFPETFGRSATDRVVVE